MERLDKLLAATGRWSRREVKQLVRQGRRFVSEMVERYGYLENYCDARYVQSLNWLRRIGFTVGEPVPYGPSGNLFCKLSIQGKE